MKPNNETNQVSLAGLAKKAPASTGKKKKRKSYRIWLILAVVVLVLIIGASIAKKIYDDLHGGPSLTARELTEYEYTPDRACEKVSYFLLGVTPAVNSTDRMDMIAVMCLDRKKDNVSILQYPVATWLGENENFAVQTLGDVWGRPQAVSWCPTCRARVAADKIEDSKHSTCGTVIEQRAGSSVSDLIRVFNTQYGLPIDNYLIVPRAGLATMINSMGGVDVKLDKKMGFDGKEYSGTATLSGEAAMYYTTEFDYNGSPASDLQRMQRQRQVMAAIVSRLSRYKVAELYNTDPKRMDVLSNVMMGRSPIRMDTSSFGKARLLGDASDSAADDEKYIHVLAEFLYGLGKIDPSEYTCSILPGESAKSGTATVYSAHAEETLVLFDELMNPQKLKLGEKAAIPELVTKKKAKSDPATATLDTVLAEQAEPTEAPTTTTTQTQESAEG